MKVVGCWLKTAPPFGMAAGQIKQEVMSVSDDYEIVYVDCPECGNRQPDMGSNMSCEECDFFPMPGTDAQD